MAAILRKVSHSYVVHYPDHAPRESDPHYKDFESYRNRTKASAQCSMGAARNDFSDCTGQLELHHAHIEFAMANEVNLTWLEKDYPGVSDPGKVGEWIETAANLVWLCEFHHRGAGGVHTASAADYEAERYISKLISGVVTK
jgi:hypothetical protein